MTVVFVCDKALKSENHFLKMNNEFDKLWVKEATIHNPLYIDLFDHFKKTSLFREAVVEQVLSDAKKDDGLADQYRQSGNEWTAQNDFKAAIEQYNKSLCFAENGSVSHSLAYANRAFCFLNLKMYDECLIDIEFAKKASYPDHLMPKLEQRKVNCLKQMTTSIERKPFEPQLSFDADDKVPSIANVLRLVTNEEFGRHFIAGSNIEEDQVVIVEEPLIKLVDVSSIYKRCHSCLKETTNVIPCQMCTKAMFCNVVCTSDNYYHQYECNMKNLEFFDDFTAENCVRFLIRAVLIGLNDFTSSEELLEFVETFRDGSNPDDIVVEDGSAKSIFGIFLNLNHLVKYESVKATVLICSCIAYNVIIGHSSLSEKFPTTNVQHFLMHLLTQLASMFAINNILLQQWNDQMVHVIERDGKETFGSSLFNISSYFNHACMPNIIRLTNTNHAVIKTIRPIKKGEQIFIRYGIDPNWPTFRRRQHLFNFCEFHCQCRLCLSNGPTLTENSVVSLEFANISMEMSQLMFLAVKDANKWKLLKDKLFKFVKKYEDMPISKSIIVSYEFIRMILTREYFYATNSEGLS